MGKVVLEPCLLRDTQWPLWGKRQAEAEAGNDGQLGVKLVHRPALQLGNVSSQASAAQVGPSIATAPGRKGAQGGNGKALRPPAKGARQWHSGTAITATPATQ